MSRLLLLYAGSAVFACALTWLVLRWLRARQILDLPNERSNHVRPTPRGGGWAIVLTVLPAWAWLDPRAWPMLVAAAFLVLVCWRDDRGGVPPLLRFGAQAIAVAVALWMMPPELRLLPQSEQFVPPLWLDRAVAALGWLWLINLTNFIDGIDGLIGGSTAVICAGAMLVLYGITATVRADEAAVLGGAALGFLVWNWRPAKLFLGDVGSVPVGFFLGWLLFTMAAYGHRFPALLLLGYLGTDATITLLRRALRGEKPWQAHRQHFYQRAVLAGAGHGLVTCVALAAQLLLVACAVWAVFAPLPAAACGALVVAALLAWMSTR